MSVELKHLKPHLSALRELLDFSQKREMDFFTLVGLGACFYFVVYLIFLWFSDCDLQLAFFEKFGQKLSKLRGKVMWVTGASTFLGQMMALEGARQNAKLALSSRSLEELEKTRELCLKINPHLRTRDILIFHFNLEEINSQKAAVKKVLRHFGRLDILIINEDKWERGAWENTSQMTDRLLFESNLFGVVSLCRLAVGYFNLKKKGNIAVASSIAGLIGVPYSGCYAGAKHALRGYLESLQFEKIGENIHTTLLCLGSSELLQENLKINGNKFLPPEGGLRRKMTAERCAQLSLTAVLNDLDEVWMAAFPILPLIYGIKYLPNVTKSLIKYLKPKARAQDSNTTYNIMMTTKYKNKEYFNINKKGKVIKMIKKTDLNHITY